MRRCSGSGVLVPLFEIRPRTSSPPAPFPASSLALSLTRMAGSFTSPPRAVSSRLRTSYPLPPQGPAPSGVSQVDPLPGTAPVQVAVVSGAAPGAASGGVASRGAASRGAEPGGAWSEGAGSGGAEPEGVEPGGAESEGAESGGAEHRGAASSGGPAGASPRLSSQQLCEWLVRRPHRRSGAPGAGGARHTGAGGAAVPTGAFRTGGVGCAGVGGPTEPGAAGAVGARAGVAGVGGPGAGGVGAVGARVGGTGAGGAGAAGAGAVDPGAGGAGDTVRPRSYFVPLLQQVLGVSSSTSLTPPFLCPPPDQSELPLQPVSPLPAPSPYIEQSGVLTERREPASCPASPVRTGRRVPHPPPPPVLGTHAMAHRPSSVPLRVPLPAPPESSLPEVPDPESDRARAASPTIARLLATTVTEPYFESATASALLAKLLDFAAACCLDYTSALVAESLPASPPSVGGECALGTDVLEDRQEDYECLAAAVPRFASMLLAPEGDLDAPYIPTPRSYAEAITGPYSSQWQAAMDAEMASWKSTGTYVDEVPPPGANIVEGMWMFRPARGDLAAPPTWLHLVVSYGLCEAPREWQDTLWTTLAAFGFAPSTANPSQFLLTDTSLPPFYVLVYVDNLVFAIADTEALTLVLQRFGFQFSLPQPTPPSTGHSLSAPPSDESVEPSGPYPELVGCLITSGMGLVLGGQGPVVLTCHADSSWVDDSATQRSSHGYTFSLGSGSVSWRSTRSSSVLSSICEAEIYTGAMAAQELRWLTYLLTDLGEQPRSPPVLYVDNKAMIALCQEHSLEHRTKHIALRYFLAQELQQRGQLRLAYVVTRANTADIFTKALPLGDHQRFSTVLGLVPTLPHLLTA
ncbi:unnamed protein product [Closterium sp. NIES-54]